MPFPESSAPGAFTSDDFDVPVGQLIWIVLRPKGDGTWYWIVKVHTNASGHFSATFTDPISATWAATFYGNGTHLECGSAEIYVRLKGWS
jgi:hypothetical protein